MNNDDHTINSTFGSAYRGIAGHGAAGGEQRRHRAGRRRQGRPSRGELSLKDPIIGRGVRAVPGG